MEISEEMINRIADRVVEKSLLKFVDVVGNLMRHNAAAAKLNTDFYKKYPEFKDEFESVRRVIYKLEKENPAMDHEELFEKAAPLIRQRIGQVKGLDVSTPPSSNFSLKVPSGDNGAL